VPPARREGVFVVASKQRRKQQQKQISPLRSKETNNGNSALTPGGRHFVRYWTLRVRHPNLRLWW
jgi:hypothetical protein